MQDILPVEVHNRRDKLGFATPEEAWFKGPLRKQVESGIEETLAHFPGLLAADAARSLARQILDGQRPFDSALWRIIIIGIWGRVLSMSV
jgi:asparagine synthase (glutamine-hydrolysing)